MVWERLMLSSFQPSLKLALKGRGGERPRDVVQKADGGMSRSFFSDCGAQLAELLRVNFDVDRLVVEKQLPSHHREPFVGVDLAAAAVAAERMEASCILQTPIDAGKTAITDGCSFGMNGWSARPS
ncbi:hypothetical protein RB195_014962 [Necator americanus]|uniref:Uncharacterized protein n=1 Tax=Necator americanus TaxID=51031 RepID=A0ABR1E3N2_NECAM